MPVTKYELSAIADHLDHPDVFICSASYEERCRAIPDIVPPDSVRHALILENKDLARYVAKNAGYLRSRYGGRSVDVAADTGDPLVTADSLVHALGRCREGGCRRYLVDITTFTHESLLILLRLLSELLVSGDKLQLCYCSAKDYAPNSPEGEKWLSKGVGEVRSVLGYPGEILPSRRTHLVVLVGFEHERASALVEAFEPSVVSLGHGTIGGSLSPKHQAANRHFHKLVRNTVSKYAHCEDFEFSCNDPWEAKAALAKVIDALPDHNVIVAPMNTKISTVGCALVALDRDAVQLCYARALHYNYQDYSAPGDTCYFFDLPDLISGYEASTESNG